VTLIDARLDMLPELSQFRMLRKVRWIAISLTDKPRLSGCATSDASAHPPKKLQYEKPRGEGHLLVVFLQGRQVLASLTEPARKGFDSFRALQANRIPTLQSCCATLLQFLMAADESSLKRDFKNHSNCQSCFYSGNWRTIATPFAYFTQRTRPPPYPRLHTSVRRRAWRTWRIPSHVSHALVDLQRAGNASYARSLHHLILF